MRRLIAILLLFAVSITHAQTDSDSDGWEIVQSCIDEPTTPPDDWSFDGVIFLRSDRAIHGMNANIPTPYIIAYNDSSGIFGLNGALSPSGEWFAVPEGTGRRAGLIVYHYDITRIRTYSTDGRRDIYTVELDRIVEIGSDLYLTSVDTPMWINDSEFLYPRQSTSIEDIDTYTINPFTNETTPSQERYQSQLLYRSNQLTSDDERLMIAHQTLGTIGSPTDSPDNTVFSYSTNATLYIGNPVSETFINLCINATGIAFSSSEEIIISTGEDILYIQDDNTYRLAYHDGIVFDWRFPNDD